MVSQLRVRWCLLNNSTVKNVTKIIHRKKPGLQKFSQWLWCHWNLLKSKMKHKRQFFFSLKILSYLISIINAVPIRHFFQCDNFLCIACAVKEISWDVAKAFFGNVLKKDKRISRHRFFFCQISYQINAWRGNFCTIEFSETRPKIKNSHRSNKFLSKKIYFKNKLLWCYFCPKSIVPFFLCAREMKARKIKVATYLKRDKEA